MEDYFDILHSVISGQLILPSSFLLSFSISTAYSIHFRIQASPFSSKRLYPAWAVLIHLHPTCCLRPRVMSSFLSFDFPRSLLDYLLIPKVVFLSCVMSCERPQFSCLSLAHLTCVMFRIHSFFSRFLV